MNNPLVSIIMPAYNSEKYIAKAIESIIKQSYTNWELLIVDDCSLDRTQEIISAYSTKESRIKVYLSTKNSGRPSIAKNIALEHVSGDYIAFLDSDDMWQEDKLMKQIELLKGSTYMLCYSGGYYIDQNDHSIKEFLPHYPNGNILKYLLFRYELNNQSVIIKKEVLKNFNEGITIGEDYNLFMKIAAQYEICSIKEKLVHYRVHSCSITHHKIYDFSEGVLFTLRELNTLYNIKFKYPLCYLVCWSNAMRHKLNYFIQNRIVKI